MEYIMKFLSTYHLDNIIYLYALMVVMVVAGLTKEHNLFDSTYGWLKSKLGSNKLVITLISLISGVLPIEGRVTVSAGVLDTATSHCNHSHGHCRHKLGPVDFLTTHHYYMWSPLEKTVILPMAALGLGYTAWLEYILPVMIVSLLFIASYIFFFVKEEEIHIPEVHSVDGKGFIKYVLPFLAAIGTYVALGGEGPYAVLPVFSFLLVYYLAITQTTNIGKILKYVKWDLLLILLVIIVSVGYIQEYKDFFHTTIKGLSLDPGSFSGMAIISAILFSASFAMGSSGKFAALVVLASGIFGNQYLLWFFAVDYSAYLLSPMHKCVVIGKGYFGTPFLTYYSALGAWAALILITAGLFTFV